MMQQSFDAEDRAQKRVDLGPMNYDRILSLGFPFQPTKRVNVNEDGVDLWQEVEMTCIRNGTPVVLEGWHRHPDWNQKLFTFPYIEAHYGDNGTEILYDSDFMLNIDS
ncbi:hypothetical protein BC939DRAFT_481693 [Gamsiella multidivaricata]|uniref:uncharacterized protein n=1 Tax=Gamsiella multidivaricata TaxID=101098 RepID=UPI00221F6F86|nr:uncharacterized protein BC939DRAFT_481693 [Gamsiella multidivaricata]KAI7816843.1 hypothetical protein BC939DRAFT_481693 [Gamsiella multidivaricata]